MCLDEMQCLVEPFFLMKRNVSTSGFTIGCAMQWLIKEVEYICQLTWTSKKGHSAYLIMWMNWYYRKICGPEPTYCLTPGWLWHVRILRWEGEPEPLCSGIGAQNGFLWPVVRCQEEKGPHVQIQQYGHKFSIWFCVFWSHCLSKNICGGKPFGWFHEHRSHGLHGDTLKSKTSLVTGAWYSINI